MGLVVAHPVRLGSDQFLGSFSLLLACLMGLELSYSPRRLGDLLDGHECQRNQWWIAGWPKVLFVACAFTAWILWID